MSTAIEFNNISKQYRLGLVSTRTLSHDLNRFWQTKIMRREDPYLKIGETNDRTSAGNSEYVWALKDIDFKVEQGDVLGIIGKNGAGKSTLLKLLSKVTGPTTGTIKAKGRIGSLLEVGTGFHPEMTGRENIFMNGAILGMTKKEITRKLDEIVDFSGCERYLDTPVKRYSSGMMVRLGFAVAAHLDPEILVVDEVLAVGDAEFQKKAIGKMQDVSKGEGRTVLFVSHNMASIRKLCTSGILLKDGMMEYAGDIHSTVEHYLSAKQVVCSDIMERFAGNALPPIYIRKVEFVNSLGDVCEDVLMGDDIRIRVYYHADEKQKIYVNIGVYNSMSDIVTRISSEYYNAEGIMCNHDGCFEFLIPNLPLVEGVYSVNFTIWDAHKERLDWLKDMVHFNVVASDFYGSGRIPSIHDSKVLIDFQLRYE